MTTVADVALLTGCPYCGQPPRSWCRTTPGGHRSSYLHEERQRPVRDLWRESFLDGLGEGLAGILWRLEHPQGNDPAMNIVAALAGRDVGLLVRQLAAAWGVEL